MQHLFKGTQNKGGGGLVPNSDLMKLEILDNHDVIRKYLRVMNVLKTEPKVNVSAELYVIFEML